MKKMAAPPPPSPSASGVPLAKESTSQKVQDQTAKPKHVDSKHTASWNKINQTQEVTSSVKAMKLSSGNAAESGLNVPESLGSELVEIVRKNTDLSYELSQLAVGSVLTYIGHSVPGISSTMESILKTLMEQDKVCWVVLDLKFLVSI